MQKFREIFGKTAHISGRRSHSEQGAINSNYLVWRTLHSYGRTVKLEELQSQVSPFYHLWLTL